MLHQREVASPQKGNRRQVEGRLSAEFKCGPLMCRPDPSASQGLAAWWAIKAVTPVNLALLLRTISFPVIKQQTLSL